MKLRKMTLNINGADRMFICDPEKDTLADVVRRLGLTGTKVGCGSGVCGSCTVMLDGKLVRSCTKKIAKIDEYSEVVTIEGIGAPRYLHPIQVAFMHAGAVQCGFCTPGFIVSTYALLQENPDPTREEVRDWFQKNRNICRCTGYKQIVDAVMNAAKVMRGECALEDIMVKLPENKEYYGQPLVRPAALAKVCGLADYGDDIELKMPENTLHAVLVQPKVAFHAKLKSINKEEAEKMPGVYKVVTAADIKGPNRLGFMPFTPRTLATGQSHPILVEDKIFNYGDVVALVVADTKAHAQEAAKKVTIDWEQLPEYKTYLEAAMPDAMRIHDDHPNVWSEQPNVKGAGHDTPELIDEAPYVVEGSFYSSREPHMPIEGDTVQAYWGDDGLLTVHCKAMQIYANIGDIAEATGLPAEKIRVVENPTGATFGWGIAAATYAMAAIACMACDDMPVALSITYPQFMALSGKRAPAYTNGRLACDKDGKIIGAEWDCGMDHGSYNELGDDLITRPAKFMFFPYNVSNCLGLTRVACTNHNYGTAYRGYGSPQAYTASEALMDMMAKKIGMDPFELRYKNIARPGDTNINQYPFREYPMEKMMDILRPIYEEVKERVAKESTPEKKRGVGIAWGGYNVTEGIFDQCTVALELLPNGKFAKYDTWQDQGQGGDVGALVTTLEALKPLGVTPDDIVLIQNDSKFCPDSGATASSRQHYMNSKAVVMAAEELMNAMRKPDGTYRTYDEMVAEGIPTKYETQYQNPEDMTLKYLDPNTGVGNPTPAFTYALSMAEVEVDTKTGKATCLGFWSVDDVGVIGNIAAVDGQAYGGLSHSIGFALTENYEDVKKHSNIAGAGIPTIKDIPDNFNLIHHCTPRNTNPFGSSGASEAFQSGGHMAVINAIENACGVRVYEIPAYPEKIKEGLEKLERGEEILPPKKYFLGSDFYEEMEYIKNNPMVDLFEDMFPEDKKETYESITNIPD
ncbi:molybdopterin-dependent oxidoreductase [Anaerovorax odorimutans]|uniref:Molybdopterin-dependent oxidoreductase n=1 Tax=Anaerovorax odorimutans TaxID=109327 RepID=A0ABT1RNS3_9FIRM|nr:molybdopterin cofactor-binding domain-containing protein [Anaerovorax odorimutans]MCQ4636846.1 molybdopterin-dependent oxidoreductase [Anaerovorax odorimutans]